MLATITKHKQATYNYARKKGFTTDQYAELNSFASNQVITCSIQLDWTIYLVKSSLNIYMISSSV